MTKTLTIVAITALAGAAQADIIPTASTADLSQTNGLGLVYSDFNAAKSIVGGDTYTAEPLVQDGISAFFTDDTQTSSFAFAAGSLGGANVAGLAGESSASDSGVVDNLDGTFTAFASVFHVDASGALSIWVDAANAGAGFVSWRADVGTVAGGTDGLAVDLGAGESFSVISATFVAFSSAGAPLGAFPMSLDSSDAAQLAGLAVVGLGGADIAGFDLSGVELQWTYEIVPAPASTALLGFGGLAAARRRR